MKNTKFNIGNFPLSMGVKKPNPITTDGKDNFRKRKNLILNILPQMLNTFPQDKISILYKWVQIFSFIKKIFPSRINTKSLKIYDYGN